MDCLPKEHFESILDFAERPVFLAKRYALPSGGLGLISTYRADKLKIGRSDVGCVANAFRPLCEWDCTVPLLFTVALLLNPKDM